MLVAEAWRGGPILEARLPAATTTYYWAWRGGPILEARLPAATTTYTTRRGEGGRSGNRLKAAYSYHGGAHPAVADRRVGPAGQLGGDAAPLASVEAMGLVEGSKGLTGHVR